MHEGSGMYSGQRRHIPFVSLIAYFLTQSEKVNTGAHDLLLILVSNIMLGLMSHAIQKPHSEVYAHI